MVEASILPDDLALKQPFEFATAPRHRQTAANAKTTPRCGLHRREPVALADVLDGRQHLQIPVDVQTADAAPLQRHDVVDVRRPGDGVAQLRESVDLGDCRMVGCSICYRCSKSRIFPFRMGTE